MEKPLTAFNRKLSWILQILVFVGLTWVINDPQTILFTSQSRPYRICLEHPSQLEDIRKTLSKFEFPEGATFEYTSPSGRIQTSPQLWTELDWSALSRMNWPTEDTTRELFRLPFRTQHQDVFVFHLQPLPEIQQSSLFAQLLKEKHIRLFLFGPRPLNSSPSPLSNTSAKKTFLEIRAFPSSQGTDILLEAQDLTESLQLFWNQNSAHVWPGPFSTLEKQQFRYSLKLPPGSHTLWARSGNSFAFTTIEVPFPLRILNLDAGDENSYLQTLLKAQGMEVVDAQELPEILNSYSVILLGGKTASRLSLESSARIQHFVQKTGGALAFFQGEPDFLPSAWNQWLPLQNIQTGVTSKSSLPQELPEKKEPEQEKDHQEGDVSGTKKIEESSLCLLIILDRSGSMQGEKLELAKQSAIACLKELKEDDLLGVIVFNQFPTWILYPTSISRESEIIQSIHRIQAEGDTFIYPALLEAQQELRKQKVSAKHIILLSDGYSQRANYRQLMDELIQNQITLSTIGIGTDFDHSLMASLSEWGSGRFYFTSDFSHITKYVILDTRKVIEEIRDPKDKPKPPEEARKKPKIVSEPPEHKPLDKKEVFPVIGYGPLFVNLSPPSVLRYRKATAREKAYIYAEVQEQPWLALERKGTGKVLHFIGHLEETWSPEWLRWEKVAPFWAQAFKHIALEKKESIDFSWTQESTPTTTVIRVSFPTILSTETSYSLTISGHAETILGALESPTTLRFEGAFPGSGFYEFVGYSAQRQLFSWKGLLYPNSEQQTILSEHSPQKNGSPSFFFSEPWTYYSHSPSMLTSLTRYFSVLLSLLLGILWIALWLRYRSRSH